MGTAQSLAAGTGFATIDFETTGVVPELNDRVIEVSVVHSDPDGTITGQWETLVNPRRDLGRQDIHGISAREILRAPMFEDIASELVELLSGRVVVAHNASFDLRFLNAELGRLDYWPQEQYRSFCTMQYAREVLGGGLSLADCCMAFDIDLTGAHRASVDAYATAQLLEAFIASSSREQWTPLIGSAPALSALNRGRVAWFPRESAGVPSVGFLDRIAVRVPDLSGTDEQAEYLALVQRCLLDRHLSEHEKDALVALASRLGIGHDVAMRLHTEYFAALAAAAWEDSVLTEDEAADLMLVADLLSIGEDARATALERPVRAPVVSPSAFVLDPGDLVALTGEMSRPREEWFRILSDKGFSPKDSVTKRVRVLAAADPDSLSGKAKKARDYGIPVISEAGLERLVGV